MIDRAKTHQLRIDVLAIIEAMSGPEFENLPRKYFVEQVCKILAALLAILDEFEAEPQAPIDLGNKTDDDDLRIDDDE